MNRTTVKIDGMMCGMCEAHVAGALRRALPVKKVTASHKRGEAVILSDAEIDKAAILAAVDATGYRVLSVETEPLMKKGPFRS